MYKLDLNILKNSKPKLYGPRTYVIHGKQHTVDILISKEKMLFL